MPRAATAKRSPEPTPPEPVREPQPAAPPPRIERGAKTSERVAAALVQEIVSANLGPGDRLPNEAAMVERFQVGRGSLREALRILEVHGLISLRSGPGGGPVVVALDPRDVARTFSLYLHLRGATVRELIEARLFVEPQIAKLAAQRLDDPDMERLREAVAFEASIPAGDERFIFASNNFHYVLATLSGNSVIDLMATALKELYTSRVVGGGLVNNLAQERLRSEHGAIADAILAGDQERAERLAREHTASYLGMIGKMTGFAETKITWG